MGTQVSKSVLNDVAWGTVDGFKKTIAGAVLLMGH
jgi:hypothetical protein